MTIFARKVDTGEVVWAYQMTPFDQWDYDGINENVLVDLNVDGKTHKVLVHFDRNGFAYVLDRTDGTLLRANKYVTDELGRESRHEDRPAGQGARALAVQGRRQHAGLPVRDGRQGPAAGGGRSEGSDQLLCADQQLVHGGRAAGALAYPAGHGVRVRQRVHVSGKAGHHGQVQEVQRADRQDGVGDPRPVSELGRRAGHRTAASLSTAAWAATSAPSIAPPARSSGSASWARASSETRSPIRSKGKQYVSVWSGIGGWIGLPVAGLDLNDKFGAIGATAMTKVGGLNKIPQGGTLYTFRIPDKQEKQATNQ